MIHSYAPNKSWYSLVLFIFGYTALQDVTSFRRHVAYILTSSHLRCDGIIYVEIRCDF